MSRAEIPDFDGPIQASRGKCVGVLWVDRKPHDIVAVTLENLDTLPAFFPIPQPDCHVIGTGDDERLCGMNGDRSDVVRVGFKRSDLLGCVVVVHAQLEIIATTHNPVLSSDEATSAHGHIGKFERFDDRLKRALEDCLSNIARVYPEPRVKSATQIRKVVVYTCVS
jgi:hypothetical protein